MNNTIVISIFGITSSKGFAVCNTLLKLNSNNKQQQYIIKGYSRNIKSKRSKYLIEQNVQMIELDLIKIKLELLSSYLINCNTVLLFTDHNNIEKEIECGIKVVDSCILSNVPQLIFSTLPCTSPISNGNIILSSFDNKYNIEQYIKLKSNQIKYISFIYIPLFYYQSFINLFPPFKININNFKYNNYNLNLTNYISNNGGEIDNIYNDTFSINKFKTNSTSFSFKGFNTYDKLYNNNNDIDDDFYSLPLPIQLDKSIHMCDRNEIGLLIKEIVDRPIIYNKKTLLLSGSYMSGREISKSIGKKYLKDIQYHYIPYELLNIFINSSNKEITNIYKFINDYNKQIKDNIDNSDIINIFNFKPSTFDDYLNKNNTIKIKSITLNQ